MNTGGAAYGLIVDKGNVGIGTQSPEGKLDIAGDFKYIKSCPSGMIKAGSDPTAYCIETNERGATSLSGAISACRNEGKRLCSSEEYIYACTNSFASGMLDNYEWTSEISWQPNASEVFDVAIGPPTCTSRSLVPASESRTYRCCSR